MDLFSKKTGEQSPPTTEEGDLISKDMMSGILGESNSGTMGDSSPSCEMLPGMQGTEPVSISQLQTMIPQASIPQPPGMPGVGLSSSGMPNMIDDASVPTAQDNGSNSGSAQDNERQTIRGSLYRVPDVPPRRSSAPLKSLQSGLMAFNSLNKSNSLNRSIDGGMQAALAAQGGNGNSHTSSSIPQLPGRQISSAAPLSRGGGQGMGAPMQGEEALPGMSPSPGPGMSVGIGRTMPPGTYTGVDSPSFAPAILPNLFLGDYYDQAAQKDEDTTDRDILRENLQELVYWYDSLPSNARLNPELPTDENVVQSIWEMIASIECDTRSIGDGVAVIQPITPELLHSTWDGLKKDQKTILAAFHGSFRKIRGDLPVPKLGYAKARIGRGEKRVAQHCFIPKKHAVPVSQFQETFKNKWNLPKPQMYIKLDFGTRHPNALSTPPLLAEPAFQTIKGHVEQSLTKRGMNKDDPVLVQMEVDDVIFSRLINLLSAVMQAAQISGIWIVVDRSDPVASSPTSELLLELAMQKCEKPPVLLYLDSLHRYQAFKPSFRVNEQLLHLYELSTQAQVFDQPLTACAKDVPSLYKCSEFNDWKPYHFKKPSRWVHCDPKDQDYLEGDRRLPRKPEDAMVQTDEHHVFMKTRDNRPLVTPQLKWYLHYRQHFYNSATHTVLFENAVDSSLPFDKFGSEGRIFAHGGNLSFERISEWISRGKPTVILLNTGGVAQSFGSLHHWCVTKKALLESRAQSQAKRASIILEKVSTTSTEPWTRRFGLPQIMMMQELEKRAPDVMRKSIIVVDGLREGPEEVVEKLTGCFAQSSSGLPELGIGTAEEDVVIEAWKMHMTLIKNCKRFRKAGDFAYALQVLFQLVGAFVSVLMTHLSLYCRGEKKDPECYDDNAEIVDTLGVSLLIIPLVAGIIGTYSSKNRYIQKWGASYTAAGQIVGEIYKFRCHIQAYNSMSVTAAEDPAEENKEDEDEAEQPGLGDPRNPRKVLVKSVQEIYAGVIESLGDDAMVESWEGKSTVDDIGNQDFKATLREHVPRTVLRSGPYFSKSGRANDIRYKTPKNIGKQLKKIEAITGVSLVDRLIQLDYSSTETNPDDDHWNDERTIIIEPDDFVSPMTIETYVEYRLRVLLLLYQKQAPPLSRELSYMETLSIVITAAGTLLAALNMTHWVVFAVTLGMTISNIAQYKCLQPRLSSINGAIRDLRSVMIYMDSLSVVEKRTTEMKTHAVATVEAAVLNTHTAWTGNSVRNPGKDKDGDEKQDKEKTQ